MRQIKCVQLPLNVQLFHIDIDHDVLRELPRVRQIVDDPGELVNILDLHADRQLRISLQSSVDENGESRITLLHKVCSSSDIDGTIQYVFTDKSGAEYADSFLSRGNIIRENLRVIWEHQNNAY